VCDCKRYAAAGSAGSAGFAAGRNACDDTGAIDGAAG